MLGTVSVFQTVPGVTEMYLPPCTLAKWVLPDSGRGRCRAALLLELLLLMGVAVVLPPDHGQLNPTTQTQPQPNPNPNPTSTQP